MLAGCLLLLPGIAITLVAIAAGSAGGFLVGTAIAGAGFGPAFLGSFGMTVAPVKPDDTAGLLAAIFTVAYLAFSVPALIAGVATTEYGLRATALVYAACLVVLVATAVAILLTRLERAQPAVRRGR